MGRRKKCRIVSAQPEVTFFKPQGVPLGRLKGVALSLEGLEALKLVDAQGLSQEEAAGLMGVSRPTLCRILGEARCAVARALSNGWAIRVEGGDYALGAAEAEESAEEVASEDTGEQRCDPGRRRCGQDR